MMLRLAGLGILLAAASPAQASDWRYVDSATDLANISFIDKDSIRANADGNLIGAMFSVMAQVEDGTSAYRFTIEVDCAGKRSRLLTGEMFDTVHKSQGESNIGGEWEGVDPGSQGQTIIDFICSKGASRAQEPSAGAALPFAKAAEMLAAQRAKKAG
jgi:hypothetical protein